MSQNAKINPELNNRDRFQVFFYFMETSSFLRKRHIAFTFAREQANMLLTDSRKMHDYEEAVRIIHGEITASKANKQSDPRNLDAIINNLDHFSVYLVFSVSEWILKSVRNESGEALIFVSPDVQTNQQGNILMGKISGWWKNIILLEVGLIDLCSINQYMSSSWRGHSDGPSNRSLSILQ